MKQQDVHIFVFDSMSDWEAWYGLFKTGSPEYFGALMKAVNA